MTIARAPAAAQKPTSRPTSPKRPAPLLLTVKAPPPSRPANGQPGPGSEPAGFAGSTVSGRPLSDNATQFQGPTRPLNFQMPLAAAGAPPAPPSPTTIVDQPPQVAAYAPPAAAPAMACAPPTYAPPPKVYVDLRGDGVFTIAGRHVAVPAYTTRRGAVPAYVPPPQMKQAYTPPPLGQFPRDASGKFLCPAGCGRTFAHPPGAVAHGKTCAMMRAVGARRAPPAPRAPPPRPRDDIQFVIREPPAGLPAGALGSGAPHARDVGAARALKVLPSGAAAGRSAAAPATDSGPGYYGPSLTDWDAPAPYKGNLAMLLQAMVATEDGPAAALAASMVAETRTNYAPPPGPPLCT